MLKKSLLILMVASAVPTFAASVKLPRGAVFTQSKLTMDPGVGVVCTDPALVVLPGMDGRSCNAQEFTNAWSACQNVVMIRGGRMTLMDCIVRAGHVQASCVLVDEPGNPILW